jgi:hypothetical protein
MAKTSILEIIGDINNSCGGATVITEEWAEVIRAIGAH